MTSLELLSPARNLECGIAAIDSGADAVYIGAERFGARAAVGNPIEDIAELCRYAHQFAAKVYVTVNTIIYDSELADTKRLISNLKDIGVDAILVQDMALVSYCHEIDMTIHASTQTDNRSIEKVRWLRSLGFKRVVLARELSAEEIKAIHEAVPDVELEVFVHGALCVSYSGQCYASQYCFHRSANRGECAQFCRMKYSLVDADGKVIERNRYLLSLKDMCQIDHIEELIASGAVSFKIEGRLKDAAYVKNVTAAYSQRLNSIVDKHSDNYRRASLGECTHAFTPNLHKTFNRGFTDYFLHGRQPDIVSLDTPKAMGEYVGKVKELRRDSFNVAGVSSFANGDGLCFVNERKELEGFRVNKAIGNRLYPLSLPHNLRPGMALYRNNDQEFERQLSKGGSKRKIPVVMTLSAVDNGFCLEVSLKNSPSISAKTTISFDHQQAKNPPCDNIVRQLSKLGETIYECSDVVMDESFNYFIPTSLLVNARREALGTLSLVRSEECGVRSEPTDEIPTSKSNNSSLHTPHSSLSEAPHSSLKKHSYLYNISNKDSKAFYEQQGLKSPQPAFELSTPDVPIIMQCRYCIRYSMGYCKKNDKADNWHEPLYLLSADGKKYRLQFDCRNCQMNILA